MRVKATDMFKLILFLAVFSNESFAAPTDQKQSSQAKQALPKAKKPKPNFENKNFETNKL